MQPKVLHIIDHIAEGGSQLPIPLNISENIAQDKYPSIVCAIRTSNTTEKYLDRAITLNCGKWNPMAFLQIAKLCRKNKITIVHAHLQKAIICSLLSSFFYKCPLIVHEHGPISQEGFSLYRLFLKLFYKRIDKMIAVSKSVEAKILQTLPIEPSNVKVIYNGIDFKMFDAAKEEGRRIRSKLNIPQNATVIGFVGRLDKIKRVDLLIKAFSLLKKDYTNCLLIIAGDGPERNKLELLIESLGLQKSVIMTGICKNVAEVMSAINIGVMPSEYESFGRVAVEFMIMKVPVVCSGAGGLKELVINNQTGLITAQNNPEEIYKSIKQLLSDGELKKHIIQKAYEFSQAFNMEQYTQNITAIYSKIHANHKA